MSVCLHRVSRRKEKITMSFSVDNITNSPSFLRCIDPLADSRVPEPTPSLDRVHVSGRNEEDRLTSPGDGREEKMGPLSHLFVSSCERSHYAILFSFPLLSSWLTSFFSSAATFSAFDFPETRENGDLPSVPCPARPCCPPSIRSEGTCRANEVIARRIFVISTLTASLPPSRIPAPRAQRDLDPIDHHF